MNQTSHGTRQSRSYAGSNSRPTAQAIVRGSAQYPNLSGVVSFSEQCGGTLVTARVSGLPDGSGCASRVFGFHIHEGQECTGNAQDPFANAGGHYNPENCPHPQHAGDMPPLFGNNGCAWMSFFTNRFTVREVLGHAVIVHANPDDFTTQPAGNSGARIACGLIRPLC